MRRAVSLSGAAFALWCIALILFVLPAGAQDDGIPPGTPVTPSEFNGGDDNPRVFTVESRGCRVPDQGATVTIQDQDGTRFKYRDGPEVEITEVGNGQVRLESVDDEGIMVPENAVSFNDPGFDPNPPITAVGSTGITGCRGGSASPAQDQYEQTAAEVDNPKGVVPETATAKTMPPTGGPPYVGVGALVLLSVALLAGGVILRP